jgi:hypothetical protein
MKQSDIFRRSSLGTGWYVIREDEGCPLFYAPTAILDAVIAAGACSVGHSGMYEPTTRATALPQGCMYEKLSSYGFLGLQEGSWLFGATAIRHVLRLLDIGQPRRLLSGETSIPTVSQLTKEWHEFTHCDRLIRVGASLGALRWMNYDRHGHFEPITLPIQWSEADRPPGVEPRWIDPLIRDSFFWVAEQTYVSDSTGNYHLTPDGNLTPA